MKYLQLILFVLIYTGIQHCNAADTLALNVQVTQQRCGGDGSITVTPVGGTPPYYYQWENGADENYGFDSSLFNLSSNTYSVTVIDVSGDYVTGFYTINDYSPLYYEGYNAGTSGCSNNAGTVQLSITGGTPPYSYVWSNGDTEDSLTGLMAGNYNFTVTDLLGCKDSGIVTIPFDTTLQLYAEASNAFCGHNNGIGSFYVNGGVPPYTYNWSNNDTGYIDSNLAAGTYSVTVADNSGCLITDSFTILSQSGLSLSFNVNNAICSDDSTGYIVIYSYGGISPYIYQWSNGDTGSIAQSLTVGTYYVTVKDENGCTDTDSATISSYNQLNVNANVIEPPTSCDSGSVTLLITGGVGPYTYIWNGYDIDTIISGDSLQTVLSGGCYNIWITDTNGCQGGYSLVYGNSLGSSFTISISSQNAVCGYANASATANPSYGPWCVPEGITGGHRPEESQGHQTGFTYLWSTGDTTQTISGLTAGTYYVTVTDSVGCTATAIAYINSTSLNMYSIFEDPECRAGSIVVAPYGGQAPYSYQWNSSDTTASWTITEPGTYTVTVKDANGCSVSQSFTSNFPASYGIGEIPNSSTPAHCGLANGVVVMGTYPWGYNNYYGSVYGYFPTLQWSNGATGAINYDYYNGTAESYLGGLASGYYTVTATDVYGCTATAAVYVDSTPNLAIAEFYTINATCSDSNGSIAVSPTDGTSPYTYLWSNYETGYFDTALAAGTYTVTVHDANSCSATGSVSVYRYSNLAISLLNATNPTCGKFDGTITANASQGTSPYSYLWSNHETGQTDTGLIAGTYTVSVTDVNGCSGTASFSLVGGNVSPHIIIENITDAHCGGPNGSAEVEVIDSAYGDGYIYYQWSNGEILKNLENVDSGTYTVTVTDQSGCSATASITIGNVNTNLTLDFAATSPSCGVADGSVTAIPSNGTYPYTYLWSNQQTNQTITGLVAGSYSVTVNDANVCSATGTWDLKGGNVSPHIIIENITDAHCGEPNGSALIEVNDSAYSYNSNFGYIWSNGEVSANLQNVNAGTYTVTATDPSGCTGSASVTVNGSPLLVLNFDVVNPCTGTPGVITVTPSGGLSPYTYSWQNHNTTASITGFAGAYSVTVTDYNGCSASDTIFLVQQDVSATSVSITAIPGDSITDGTLVVFTADAVNGGPYPAYQWQKNGLDVGSNSPAYTDAGLQNGDVVTCIMATSLSCAFPVTDTSTQIEMYVYVIPSVTIVANGYDTLITGGGNGGTGDNGGGSNGGGGSDGGGAGGWSWWNGGTDGGGGNSDPHWQICQGASVTFTATPFNGGLNPSYQWYLNGGQVGEDDATYTTSNLEQGDEIYVEMTSSAPNANPAIVQSTPITIDVNTPSYSITSATICQGGSFVFDDNVYTEEGDYTVEALTSANGCDSLVILELTVNQPSSSILIAHVCNSQSYSFNGHSYDSAGVYIIDGLTNADGCDSTVTLYLIFNQAISDTINVSICTGNSYLFNGHLYNTNGTYNAVYTSIGGCDSIVTLNLSVLPYLSNTINAIICQSAAYNFNGRMLNSPGNYTDTLTSAGGCDSIISLNLSVSAALSSAVNVGICPGSVYIFNGRVLASPGTYTSTFTSFSGCDSTVTLTLTLAEQLTDTFAASVCAGDSFNFNGHKLAIAGTYTDTVYAIGGCDSIVTLDLIILPTVATDITQTICQGQNYGGHIQNGTYIDTLTSVTGCDSIRTLHLTVLPNVTSTIAKSVCQGQNYLGDSVTGTYTDTLQGAASNGCDSIVTLHLTVLPVFASYLTDTVCSGQTIIFNHDTLAGSGYYVETLTAANGCDSVVTLHLTVLPVFASYLTDTVCSDQTVIFNHDTLTGSGYYVEILTAANGCDSVVTLHLTVLPVFASYLTDTVCSGQTVIFNHDTLTGSGYYVETLTAANGCDSVVTLHLTVLPVFASYLTDTVCSGQTVIFNHDTLTGSGYYVETLTAANGCDSVVTLHLTVLRVFASYLTDTVCSGQTVIFNSDTLTGSGYYVETLTAANGCDSVVTLHLTVLPAFASSFNESICHGESIVFDGQTLTLSGNYNETLAAKDGCDSTVTLNLTVWPVYSESFNQNICSGGVFMFNGQALSVSGSYTDTLNSVNGCDSIITLNLNVLSVLTTSFHAEICIGSNFDFNGQALSVTGVYADTLTASGGCDSIVTLQLEVLQLLSDTINAVICQGAVYEFNGQVLSDSGIYRDTLTATGNCDSIVVLNLSVVPVFRDTLDEQICSGGLYILNGHVLTESNTYTDTLTSISGCDSIVTLHLTVLPVPAYSYPDTICSGQDYIFKNDTLSVSGSYTDTLTAANGCDSVVNLHLTVLPVSAYYFPDTICSGQTFIFNHDTLTGSGYYVETLTAANGCDSVVTLHLTVLPVFASYLTDTVCSGQTIIFNNDTLTGSGYYVETLTAANGCDSVVTLHLTVLPVFASYLTDTVCNGQTVIFNSDTLTGSGYYVETLTAVNGCDSVVTLHLTVLPVFASYYSDTICSGYHYVFKDDTLTASGIYNDTVTAINGCDSIITLSLVVLPATSNALAGSICSGSSYNFNGHLYSATGIYTDTLSGVNGCDSFVILHLTVLSSDSSALLKSICPGSNYLFNGHLLTTSGTYIDTLSGANGCDSIVRLSLTVLSVIRDSVTAAVCAGGSYQFNGRSLNSPGVYSDTLTTPGGCDSVVALSLTLLPNAVGFINDSICSGSSYNFNGHLLSTTGIYTDTLIAGNSCDSVVTLHLTVKSMNDSAKVSGPLCTASQSGVLYQWIYCNTSTPVSGATSQTYTAVQNGSYQCIVTVDNCTDTTNCISVTSIGFADVNGYNFNLYPNPNAGIFTIEHNYKGNLTVQIVSIVGNNVMEFNLTKPVEQFNISELAGGVYQVLISDNKQLIKVMKIVKQ